MSIFLKIISILAIIAAIVIPIIINGVRRNRSYRSDDYKAVKKKYSVITVAIAVVMFIVSCSFVIIPTGYTGVRTTFGQIDSTTVQNGFNWKLPFVQSIEQVNNKQQSISFDGQVWSETNERTAIYYDSITVTYQISPDKSAWIYTNVANYRDTLINQSIVASAIKASSKSLSDTDATNRSIIEPLAMENLQKSLDQKYGEDVIYITKVIIGNADFEDGYNQAIAAKQQAQLEAEKQEIENQKAIDKAAADAAVKKTTAEADAEAKLISAQAEAEANDLLEKSLTDQILREMWIEKWNGQLPQYVAGGESSVMIGIGTDSE